MSNEESSEIDMKSGARPRRPGRRKGVAGQPVLFITKSQLAHALGVDPGTVDDWVREGSFPPPHSRPGSKTALWLRDHFDAYVKDRRWPRESYYGREDLS